MTANKIYPVSGHCFDISLVVEPVKLFKWLNDVGEVSKGGLGVSEVFSGTASGTLLPHSDGKGENH